MKTLKVAVSEFTRDFKKEVFDYHYNLIINDRGYGGSITKRVRERFNLTGDQVSDIYNEMKKQNESGEML